MSLDLSLGLTCGSGYSSTFSVDSDGSEHSPLAAGGLRHPTLGRGHPAQGHEGLHDSAFGRGRSFLNYPREDAAAAAVTGRMCMDTHHQEVVRVAQMKAGVHLAVPSPTMRKGSDNSPECKERDLLDSIWPENGSTRLRTLLRTQFFSS